MESFECKNFSQWLSNFNVNALRFCKPLKISGVSFFIKDLDSRLLYMNKKFLPRIGLDSNEELFGKTDFDLFPLQFFRAFS